MELKSSKTKFKTSRENLTHRSFNMKTLRLSREIRPLKQRIYEKKI